MGLLDKIMFWKKEEPEFSGLEPGPFNTAGAGPQFGQDITPPVGGFAPPLGAPDFGEPHMGTPQPSPFGPPSPMSSMQTGSPAMMSQPQQGFVAQTAQMELISSKLDTIKVQLENLNQRIAHLERIAEGE